MDKDSRANDWHSKREEFYLEQIARNEDGRGLTGTYGCQLLVPPLPPAQPSWLFLAASNHPLAPAKAAVGGHKRCCGAESHQGHLSPSASFPRSLLQLSLLPGDGDLKQRKMLRGAGNNRE